jgi:hypothetical protein
MERSYPKIPGGDTMAIADEILDLEHRFWQTMISRDVETATALMGDSSIITGAQGVSQIDKASFARMLTGGAWKLLDYNFDEVKVIAPTADVAVIGYKVVEHVEFEGRSIELRAADASTWVRQAGEWVCVLHTESVLGDPFGRDRAA